MCHLREKHMTMKLKRTMVIGYGDFLNALKIRYVKFFTIYELWLVLDKKFFAVSELWLVLAKVRAWGNLSPFKLTWQPRKKQGNIDNCSSLLKLSWQIRRNTPNNYTLFLPTTPFYVRGGIFPLFIVFQFVELLSESLNIFFSPYYVLALFST